MALTNDDLSLWEIAHRIHDYNPDRFSLFRVPFKVKDSIRLLMNEILKAHLDSILIMEKRRADSDAPPEFYIRHHIDDIYECIAGRNYSKRLLQFITISREDFRYWCENAGHPLPPFWFSYDWTYPDDLEDLDGNDNDYESVEDVIDPSYKKYLASLLQKECRHRNSKLDKTISQAIARTLWDIYPEMTITKMVEHTSISIYGNGRAYTGKNTVRDWVRQILRPEESKKAGRPKKQ